MEFSSYELQSILLDVMPSKYMFKESYRVLIPDHFLWLKRQLDLASETRVWYTDGSLKRRKSRMQESIDLNRNL